MGQIAELIESYTCDNSKYDQHRNYISLSHILLKPEEILNQFKAGYNDSKEIRLKCYKGYQMEKDLLERMKNVFGSRLKTSIEISEYNSLVQGHPDFTLDSFPGDCKSVLMDDYLPEVGKLPRKVYWQMQAYMKYMKKEKAVVIYESRESGKIKDYWINANPVIQKEIGDKIEFIVNTIIS